MRIADWILVVRRLRDTTGASWMMVKNYCINLSDYAKKNPLEKHLIEQAILELQREFRLERDKLCKHK